MKVYIWQIETIATLSGGTSEVFSISVETLEKSYQTSMDIAVMKTERILARQKKDYKRIVVSWVEIVDTYTRSKYGQYKQLVQLGKSRQTIRRLLRIDFSQLSEFEKRFARERRKKVLNKNVRKEKNKKQSSEKIVIDRK
ncbi:hypothetical protein CUS80_00250 [Enterococcus faecium]|uniref:hypothetical protein n=1 Tax=Enterococcus faecium TaxID=1352 RepID=UPI000CF302F8|nr:hypothetical protein [Enterococcus faecium]PQG48403.1 hypothetical protein CUS80_00250 [Enterococcus faecium]